MLSSNTILAFAPEEFSCGGKRIVVKQTNTKGEEER